MFAEYAPLSWVMAGFAGLFVYALCVAIYGFGQGRRVRAKYDAKFMQESGGVDPLAKVFEDKRIFLNNFVLPSNPVVEGKTFVGCEIVGPANLYLQDNNRIDEIKPILVDAVALTGEKHFYNGFVLNNCTFRNCTFHRVTLFFKPDEVKPNLHLGWLNWISPLPLQASLPGVQPPSQIEDHSDLSSEGTE